MIGAGYGARHAIDQVVDELADFSYIADRALATVLFLAHRLEKPIFLEGEPGVGKTEVGIVMSRLFDTELIRLQCYEGLDSSTALYEWNYPKQLLHIRLEEQGKMERNKIEQIIYSPDFLIKRPLDQEEGQSHQMLEAPPPGYVVVEQMDVGYPRDHSQRQRQSDYRQGSNHHRRR